MQPLHLCSYPRFYDICSTQRPHASVGVKEVGLPFRTRKPKSRRTHHPDPAVPAQLWSLSPTQILKKKLEFLHFFKIIYLFLIYLFSLKILLSLNQYLFWYLLPNFRIPTSDSQEQKPIFRNVLIFVFLGSESLLSHMKKGLNVLLFENPWKLKMIRI